MRSFATNHFRFIDFTEMSSDLSRQVFECRNHPEIRRWMVNDKPILRANHDAFVLDLSRRNDVLYFCVIKDGIFIGSINIHSEGNNVAERGIYIHPVYQGKGYSKLICIESYDYFHKNYGLNHIITKVKKNNISSNSLEKSLGATLEKSDEELNYYRLILS